jgi:hypothetical protein
VPKDDGILATVPVISIFFGILIRQWAQLNRGALDANWSKIQAGQALDRIPPLE